MMNELRLFKQAKELCSYVMVITENSPKKFRWTITQRMHGLCLDIIEQIYLANDVYITEANAKEMYRMRRKHQNTAFARLKILGFMSELAMKRGVILPKQFERISKLSAECQNLLGGWVKSDRKQLKQKFGLSIEG